MPCFVLRCLHRDRRMQRRRVGGTSTCRRFRARRRREHTERQPCSAGYCYGSGSKRHLLGGDRFRDSFEWDCRELRTVELFAGLWLSSHRNDWCNGVGNAGHRQILSDVGRPFEASKHHRDDHQLCLNAISRDSAYRCAGRHNDSYTRGGSGGNVLVRHGFGNEREWHNGELRSVEFRARLWMSTRCDERFEV
jgi:hypothetical protein